MIVWFARPLQVLVVRPLRPDRARQVAEILTTRVRVLFVVVA
jgi:hypothetical protein